MAIELASDREAASVEAQRRHSAADASEASRLALLGHDLRAAVSDIVGGLRLIAPQELGEGARLQLERVRAASEGLARLLEDALANMVDAELTGSPPTSLSLGRLLRDVELRWAGRAREKGLNFEMIQGDDLPRVIRLDRIALERILSNLLSNAVKYTDSGAISMTVEQSPTDALIFSIRDDGPGFKADPDDPLGTEGKALPRAGTGLGLKIAHEMAGRLGGRIAVGNREEGGAELILKIPRSNWQPDPATPATMPGLPDLSQMKILIAEDSEANQLLLAHMLTTLGADVEIAGDGIEALNKLEVEAFDAALIDIEMPRLSGIEVMRSIRAGGGRHAAMPILAVTAYVLRANREAIYAAGADSILAKPLSGLDALGAAMSGLLARRREHPPAADPPANEALNLDTTRFDALMDIAGPDGRIELQSRLLSDLHRVERGLIQGCIEPDYAMIRSQTHVLIAVAGAVGAERLMGVARRLNGAAHSRSAEELKDLAPEVLALLDDLIHFVSGHVHSRAEPT